MLNRLKKSDLGQWLYRVSRGSSPLARILSKTARIVQTERSDLRHLHPANRAHNRRQEDILAAFEAKLGRPGS